MGNNAAWSQVEEITIKAYDLGKLDEALMSVILEAFRDSDADTGGRNGLTTKDGLEFEEVVLRCFEIKSPKRPALPEKYHDWTPEHDTANDIYRDAISDLIEPTAL